MLATDLIASLQEGVATFGEDLEVMAYIRGLGVPASPAVAFTPQVRYSTGKPHPDLLGDPRDPRESRLYAYLMDDSSAQALDRIIDRIEAAR